MKRLIRVKVELPAKVYRKDAWYIADCELLNLRSQGRTESEALAQLGKELELFIEVCYQRDTLDQVLSDCGFERAELAAGEGAADILIGGDPDEHTLSVQVPPAFLVSRPDAGNRAR